jgi:hypothetical protein
MVLVPPRLRVLQMEEIKNLGEFISSLLPW